MKVGVIHPETKEELLMTEAEYLRLCGEHKVSRAGASPLRTDWQRALENAIDRPENYVPDAGSRKLGVA
jgi:hypothetical protein